MLAAHHTFLFLILLRKSESNLFTSFLMLENLRFHKGELDNCSDFSKLLSFHGDVYINDAFGTAHRSHASNIGVATFFNEKASGFLMQKELQYLKVIMKKIFIMLQRQFTLPL